MDNNIQLKLIGITFNQIESGVYALILEDIVYSRRLAIVIGYPEAQSIECHLQKVRTPRPLTHDLLANLLKQLNVKLLRVDIHRLVSGPFAGKLTLETESGEIIELDARSSDAIALAIRVNAPIFTNKELLEKDGYTPSSQEKKSSEEKQRKVIGVHNNQNYTLEKLHEMLNKYVEEENYEAAAEIKNEIERRKNQD